MPIPIQFFESIDFSTVHNLHGSDFVELYHCNVTSQYVWLNMWNRSRSMVQGALNGLREPLRSEVGDDGLGIAQQHMREEFLLEMLEQYASFEGLCDFRNYRPTVPPSVGQTLVPRLSTNNSTNFRIVFCISAYHDIDHLVRLVQALGDENLVLIHLERAAPHEYRNKIEIEIPQAIVIQFGTIVYRTDSLSLINLRIMRWLTIELNFQYDYIVLMDGAAFPLLAPNEWKTHITQRSVWLGELTHKGKKVVENGAEARLLRQRLISTPHKLHKRLESKTWKETVPPTIQRNLIHKSTSGNQGAYHRHIVKALLEADDVMELFALSKYGCCCCLEENNWITALGIVGFAEEALQQASTFQVWGGTARCEGSMNNAILEMNSSFCFRSEDPHTPDLYFYGDRMMDELKSARSRGTLMARKFQSNHPSSDLLLKSIEEKLWLRSNVTK